jgi:CHAD domain-containing protein
VASRRLREILPLVLAVPGKTKRRVRRLTRVLGRVRELDVALQLLEKDPVAESAPRLALMSVREHVRSAREHRRERMLQKLRDLDLKKMQRGLDKLAVLAQQDNPAWRRTLAVRLTRRAKALREAVSGAGAIYLPDRLHAVRLSVKKLRYALELAAEAGAPRAAALAVIVRRAQVRLGHLQDRSVLLREVLATADASGDEAVRHGLTLLGGEIERSARELHAQYVAHRDELLEVISEIQHQVVPELARAARRRVVRATLASVGEPRRGRMRA